MTAARTFSSVLDSNVFLATLSGLYLCVFFGSNNITLLSFSSMAVVAVAFIAPPVLAACVMNVIAPRWLSAAWAKGVTVFVSIAWVAIALHAPVFSLESMQAGLAGMSGSATALAWVFLALVIALGASWLFRRDSRVPAVMLGVMTLVSLAGNAASISTRLSGDDPYLAGTGPDGIGRVEMAHRPNIYLILADGYVNFAHLRASGLASVGFEQFLAGAGFMLYDEFFSNYHPTTASMAAMLDMQHHYYAGARKFGEITSGGRAAIGGRNRLVQVLRQNGYSIHYVHQGIYLLTQGCSADSCFPSLRLDGARMILRSAIPGLSSKTVEWATIPTQNLLSEVGRVMASTAGSGQPRFNYIHLYRPFHVPNNVQGVCNEAGQRKTYGDRLAATNHFLEQLVGEVIEKDPEAVIVLAGDHGPLISNRCDWTADIDEAYEYEDRVGAVLAVRWPENYDSRYDKSIRTSVNLFRFLLASMTADDGPVLDTLVKDDVFVEGAEGKLQIMSAGEMLIPPMHLTEQELESLRENREVIDERN